jgi:hypothetical protein
MEGERDPKGLKIGNNKWNFIQNTKLMYNSIQPGKQK